MAEQPQQIGSFREGVEITKGLGNLFILGCMGVAATIYPFMRTRFGMRYFGLVQVSGLPISWLFAVTTCMPHNIWPFTYFTYAYLGVCFIQRFVTSGAFRKGYYHSRYNGYPLVCRYLKVSEMSAKMFVEPMIVAGIGLAIMFSTNHSFGLFMFFASIAMLIDHAYMVDLQRRRAMEIRDQELMNQSLSHELETMR